MPKSWLSGGTFSSDRHGRFQKLELPKLDSEQDPPDIARAGPSFDVQRAALRELRRRSEWFVTYLAAHPWRLLVPKDV